MQLLIKYNFQGREAARLTYENDMSTKPTRKIRFIIFFTQDAARRTIGNNRLNPPVSREKRDFKKTIAMSIIMDSFLLDFEPLQDKRGSRVCQLMSKEQQQFAKSYSSLQTLRNIKYVFIILASLIEGSRIPGQTYNFPPLLISQTAKKHRFLVVLCSLLVYEQPFEPSLTIEGFSVAFLI